MVFFRSWACLITLAALLLAPGPSFAQANLRSLEIVAQIFEPAQMYRHGKPVGFTVDLMQEIRKRVQFRTQWEISEISMFPWHRAYDKAISKPNMLMFSISRTPEREARFIWAGKIFIYDVHFYSLFQSRLDHISSLHKLIETGQRFGVPNKGQVNAFAHEEGFVIGRDFITYPHYSRGVRMLFEHQLGAIPLLSHNAHALVCREGFDGKKIHSLFRSDKLTKPLWMVFSKGTAPEIVTQFQKALKEVQDEKMDLRLQTRYVSEFQNTACGKSEPKEKTPMVSLLSVP